eukprot:TRINITY_DN3876_c0_g1_i1.p1 TRINITY_DN3876_c0_g1~~TRINITY_DN3876_c0_g1_i1.p1  ORF type:complete len:181 (+),score=35.44 TRINITY_DN3876_c0_g1_i1:76-543(+)
MHYLVGVDATPYSEKAVDTAIKMIDREKDSITLIHALEPSQGSIAKSVGEVYSDPQSAKKEKRWKTERKSVSHEVKQKYTDLCVSHQLSFKYVEKKGTPVEVISKISMKIKPDILVLGTRNLNVVQRLFIGSVSKYFVDNPPCPVLVVPFVHSNL